jgi:hypothetical protein
MRELLEIIDEYAREAYHGDGCFADVTDGEFTQHDFVLYVDATDGDNSSRLKSEAAAIDSLRFNQFMWEARKKHRPTPGSCNDWFEGAHRTRSQQLLYHFPLGMRVEITDAYNLPPTAAKGAKGTVMGYGHSDVYVRVDRHGFDLPFLPEEIKPMPEEEEEEEEETQ